MAAALRDHPPVLGPVAVGDAEGEDHRAPVERLQVADLLLGAAGAAVEVDAGVGVDVEGADAGGAEGVTGH